jgi:glycosyltransferase involved in cell wall biosynthesis
MPMKVCHLSTFWPNRFGHTHYTDNLIAGMRGHRPERHDVLAEFGSAAAETEAYRCVPCFSRRQDYVAGIMAEARKLAPEVMEIQYSNDLFGEDNRFPRLLAELRAAGIRTIVNTHSIYPRRRKTGFRPGGTCEHFDRAMAQHASRLQVHTPRMKRDLMERGVPEERIVFIPHGSKAIEQRDPLLCRRELGLPENAKVVLFFGFIWRGKGLEFLLRVFQQVARQVPEAYLLVAGHTERSIWGFYVSCLRALARVYGIGDRCRFWGEYVDDERVPAIYSAADVVVMPYRQNYSSVSGVVHQTAGIGKLMLCSRIAKFDEVESIDARLTAPYGDRRAWSETMVRLLTDAALGQQLRSKIIRFGEETSWIQVGQAHVQLCEKLLAAE